MTKESKILYNGDEAVFQKRLDDGRVLIMHISPTDRAGLEELCKLHLDDGSMTQEEVDAILAWGPKFKIKCTSENPDDPGDPDVSFIRQMVENDPQEICGLGPDWSGKLEYAQDLMDRYRADYPKSAPAAQWELVLDDGQITRGGVPWDGPLLRRRLDGKLELDAH